MIWLLANWRMVAVAALIAIPSGYAAIMKVRFEHARAALTQYKAEVAAAAAEAEVRNAHTAAQQEKNAREALDDLQTRHDAIRARYDRLRNAPAGGSSGGLPAAPGPAAPLGAGLAGERNAAARCVAEIEGRILTFLEAGDHELAKHRELWELGIKNAR